MLRALAADNQTVDLPASCEVCGQIDLWPANYEAWKLYIDYPSLITNGMDGWQVNYQAGFELMDRMYMPNVPLMLKKLEAIKTGYASVK